MSRYETSFDTDDLHETIDTIEAVADRLGYDSDRTEARIGNVDGYDEDHAFRTSLADLDEPAHGEIVDVHATVRNEQTGDTLTFDYTEGRDDTCQLQIDVGDERAPHVETYLEEHLGPDHVA